MGSLKPRVPAIVPKYLRILHQRERTVGLEIERTLFHDLFSCMKITTCSMSFKEPLKAGLVRDGARINPSKRPIMLKATDEA